jgi:hypothetical protein
MLTMLKMGHKKQMVQFMPFTLRFFARNVATPHHLNPKGYEFPTQQQEFDAHRFKMEGKLEDSQAKQYYKRTSGRNVFRYDTQFPEFSNEYRSTIQQNEADLFKKIGLQKRREFDRRQDDIVRLIRSANQIKKRRSKHETQIDSGAQTRNDICFNFIAEIEGTFDKDLNAFTYFADGDYIKDVRKRLDIKIDMLAKKLKSLDYRDFLAVNKYVIESRNSKLFHQQARSQILSIAMTE